MWGEIDAVIKNVDLRASLQEGKLTIGRIGDDAGGIGLLHAARGPAQTLDDLLRRGQFEQMAPLLAHLDAPGLRLVRGIPTEVEPADVVLVAAAVGTDMFIRHARSIEDVGLPAYAGADPVTAGFVIGGLILAGLGYWFWSEYCGGNIAPAPTSLKGVACFVAVFLMEIGLLFLFALLLLGGAWLTGIYNPGISCDSNVVVIGTDGSMRCVPGGPPQGSSNEP